MTYLKAFSLIELVTVIAIITIITAISIPVWRAFAPSFKLRQETERIVQELRLAQQKTVTEQITYLVRFNKEAESYEVIRLLPDPENPDNYIPETVESETLDPEIGIDELYNLTEPEIKFTAAGGVVEAGQIELVNNKGDTKLIDVRPSGFINY